MICLFSTVVNSEITESECMDQQGFMLILLIRMLFLSFVYISWYNMWSEWHMFDRVFSTLSPM